MEALDAGLSGSTAAAPPAVTVGKRPAAGRPAAPRGVRHSRARSAARWQRCLQNRTTCSYSGTRPLNVQNFALAPLAPRPVPQRGEAETQIERSGPPRERPAGSYLPRRWFAPTRAPRVGRGRASGGSLVGRAPLCRPRAPRQLGSLARQPRAGLDYKSTARCGLVSARGARRLEDQLDGAQGWQTSLPTLR
jgi:hypothetical protein